MFPCFFAAYILSRALHRCLGLHWFHVVLAPVGSVASSALPGCIISRPFTPAAGCHALSTSCTVSRTFTPIAFFSHTWHPLHDFPRFNTVCRLSRAWHRLHLSFEKSYRETEGPKHFSLRSILGFHVTSEKTKIKNFEFSPSSGKSHF